MGCWVETCGITQLPIESGEKVRLFVLISQNHWNDNVAGGGTCYPNDIWDVFGPPIQGTYNSYGSIDNIVEDENTNLLLNRIKEYWIPFTTEYDEVSNMESMPLAEVLYWIERDKAKTQRYGQIDHFGMMMVHETVYQTMISYNPIEAHFYRSGYEYLPLIDGTTNLLRNWYNECSQKFSDLKDSGSAQFVIALSDSHFFDHKENGIRLYKSVLTDFVFKGIPWEHDEVQKVTKPLIEMAIFNAAFRAARKMWHPQSGKGSSDSSTDIHRELSLAMNKIISEKEEERGSCREEDENGYAPYMIAHNIEFRAKKAQKELLNEKDI